MSSSTEPSSRMKWRAALKWAAKVLSTRIVLVLTVLFGIGSASAVWQLSNMYADLTQKNAIAQATLYDHALAEFRTLYTSEVVNRVRNGSGSPIEVTHDYRQKEGAIPLPATLSMELGRRLGEVENGVEARLYSPYPFPWRVNEGGIRDAFGQQAWEQLTQNPREPFYRFEEIGGVRVLRYATADLMRPECVNCHNTHPDTPKSDWKTGDVRGVLETRYPMAGFVSETRARLGGMVVILICMIGVGLCAMSIATRRIRRDSVRLERRVAERTEALGELQRARQEADAANLGKSQFLANMSHEIRTPMTAILGYADELLEGGDLTQIPPERLHSVNSIRRNGRHLLQIINDILDLSKLDAGRLTTERILFSPLQIVAEVASMMRCTAAENDLVLSFEYPNAIPERIEGDPTRLRQVLINLVGNSIKFTHRGTIRVVTRLLEDTSVPSMRFEVIDSGIGMTPEEITRLFEPFSQADSSTTRKYGGSGLGLNICHRLVQTMDGVIEVESEPGAGSTFRVTLPVGSLEGVRLIENPSEAMTISEECVSDPTRETPSVRLERRILLAEDSPDNQLLIRRILERSGATVEVAGNGQIALERALNARESEEPFDVILMDMQMPVLDGYDATRGLRHANYDLPIIALTAHVMPEDQERCMNAGCDAFAIKPIDKARLIEVISRYASSPKGESPLPA